MGGQVFRVWLVFHLVDDFYTLDKWDILKQYFLIFVYKWLK